MTELEKIAYAKSFIDRLALGIDPITGFRIPAGEVANNPRLLKCFAYVSELLEQVIDNGGIPKPKVRRTDEFTLTPEQAARFEYSETPIKITEVARRLYAAAGDDKMKKISGKALNDWLQENALLYSDKNEKGNEIRRPTELGRRTGIYTETVHGQYGDYTAVLYTPAAQSFIVSNVQSLVLFVRRKKEEKRAEKYASAVSENED